MSEYEKEEAEKVVEPSEIENEEATVVPTEETVLAETTTELLTESDSEEEQSTVEGTKIHEKEKIVPQMTADTTLAKKEQALADNQSYLSGKEQDRQEIVQMIHEAEVQLADLRMRKAFIESGFSELLGAYQQYILADEPISPIARTSLVEYFAYELLKPLNDIGLELSRTTYDTWETRHFSINYALDDSDNLIFSFALPTIDERYQVDAINLLKVSPETMTIDVKDDQVLALIRYWSVERVFSVGQMTIFNHKLNQLLEHARQLGFTVNETLLDNTKVLRLNLQSEFELTEQVLDDIFIVAMEHPQYDMEKLGEDAYEVLLDKGQSLTVSKEGEQTALFVSSGEYHRSVIDFFINYEFLIPLMVRKV